MDITNWCILASILLISTNADDYDQGLQHFYDSSTASQAVPNYETKDILLYLTPSQVQELEERGAVLKPQESDVEQTYPAETGQEEEEESEQSSNQTENFDDQRRKQVSELEEIFRILNEQIERDPKRFSGDIYRGQVSQASPHEQEEEEGEQQVDEIKQREEQVDGDQDDKQFENLPRIPSRFGTLQRYRVAKYLSPSIIQKENQQINNFRRPSSHYHKSTRLHQYVNRKSEINRDKYEIIPVEEKPQEGNKQNIAVNHGQNQLTAYLNALLSNNKVIQSIAQHRDQLLQHELQLYKGRQELNGDPKHINKNYAAEIGRLKANLEAQNALLMAVVISRAKDFLSQEEINTKLSQHDNTDLNIRKRLKNFALRGPQPFAPIETSTPIPVPVIKRSRIEIKSPTPIKTERVVPVLSTENIYVNIDNPYVERFVPVDSEEPIRTLKPEHQTIIRHLWEH